MSKVRVYGPQAQEHTERNGFWEEMNIYTEFVTGGDPDVVVEECKTEQQAYQEYKGLRGTAGSG